MKVVIGTDHAGFELKEHIKKFLEDEEISYYDCGTHNSKSIDYPDIAVKTVKEFKNKTYDFGLLICGSGIGMSIAANKFKGIRASLCTSTEMAKLARLHNNANILCLGSRITGFQESLNIISEFFFTEFSNETRHQRRIEKINNLTGLF